MIRQAVILAAGMGTRLRGELDDRPKGFIELGERPIIVESLERLRAAGIEDVVIVTGQACEADVQGALAEVGALPVNRSEPLVLRIEQMD